MFKQFIIIVIPMILAGSIGYYLQTEGTIDSNQVIGWIVLTVVFALNIPTKRGRRR